MDEQPWRPIIGIRAAAGHLAIRSGIALVVWGALIWLATPVLNFLAPLWLVYGLLAAAMAVPGIAIGHALSRRLTEIAGMAGPPVALLALGFGWAVVILGVLLPGLLRPLGDWQEVLVIGFTGLWTLLWVAKSTLVET